MREFLFLTVLVLTALPFMASAEGDPSPTFTEGLLSYEDLRSLPREKRAIVLDNLRGLFVEMSTDGPRAGARYVTTYDLWWLVAPAVEAASDSRGVACGLDDGSQPTTCYQRKDIVGGGMTRCLCSPSEERLRTYAGPGYKPASSGGCGTVDGQPVYGSDSDYREVYVGGQRRCVTHRSYREFTGGMTAPVRERWETTAVSPTAKVKPPADGKLYDGLEELSSSIGTSGGVSATVMYPTPTTAQDAATLSSVTLQDAERLRATAAAAAAASGKEREFLLSKLGEFNTRLREAGTAARAKIESALKESGETVKSLRADPDAAPKNIIAGTEDAANIAAVGGTVAAREEQAAGLVDQGAKALDPSVDPRAPLPPTRDGVAAASELRDTSEKLRVDGKEIRRESKSLLQQASDLVKEKANVLKEAGAESLQSLQDKMKQLGAAIEKGTADEIAKRKKAVEDELAKVKREAKIEPTSAAPAEPAKKPNEAEIKCLKNGTYQCVQRKDAAKWNKARSDYFATHKKESQCFFGGNVSKFSENVERRRGKTNELGCEPVREFKFKREGKEVSVGCPAPKGNQKLVLCNPMFFGAKQDGDKLVGNCVDWNSVVTYDCNHYYGRTASAKKAPVPRTPAAGAQPASQALSADDLLMDEKNDLGGQWTDSMKALSGRCNSAEFRQIHCQECQTISQRLNYMKLKAGENCAWPSELGTVRGQLKTKTSR